MTNKRGILPVDVNRRCIANAVPSMRYDGSVSFEEWQKKAREQLTELLCMPTQKVEPLLETEYDEIKENWREIRFTFQSEKDYFVPCHLLIPLGLKHKNATVICLQGHSTGMHYSVGASLQDDDDELIRTMDKDFAVQSVQRGYCSLAMEQRCFGECGGTPEPDCNDSSYTALLIGRTTVGERVWDISRAIDVLEQYFTEFVDMSRIYCTGNSGGGTATFYASCVEERIAASMPSCAVCTYSRSIGACHHCICNYIPHIAEYFDMSDLCGLITPRPFVIVSGKHDGIFPLDGARVCADAASEFYKNAGVPEKFEWVVGSQGHRFYKDICWDALQRVTAE